MSELFNVEINESQLKLFNMENNTESVFEINKETNIIISITRYSREKVNARF